MTQQTNDQAAEVIPAIDDAAASAEALREKLADAQTPGYQAEFDPDEADRAGAFAEDALSEGDALASTDDLSVGGVTDPRELVARLWPLDDLAAAYRSFIATYEGVPAQHGRDLDGGAVEALAGEVEGEAGGQEQGQGGGD